MWILTCTALAAPLLEAPLNDLVQPAVEAEVLGAVVVGVVRRGETAIHGFGTLANGKAPTEKDRFEIGSVSKALNGLLLAQALQRGEVALDDPVTQHLDWSLPVGADATPITLRHLATHTSGWPRLPAGFEPTTATDPYAGIDLPGLQRLAESTPLVDSPGTSYGYSNLGASVLGAALAKAAKRPWSTLLDERLAVPMKLRDLAVDGTSLVQGHDVDLRPVPAWTFDAFAPTGGVEASARDLVDLLVVSQVPGGALRQTFDRALAPIVDLGDAGHMALGWHVTREGIRWHNGETGGFHTLIALHAERSIAVVVLADTASPLVDAIGFSALEMLAGQNVPPLDLPPHTNVDVASLKPHQGRWGTATVTLNGDHLIWNDESGASRLWPLTPTTFTTRRPARTLSFSADQVSITSSSGLSTVPRSK